MQKPGGFKPGKPGVFSDPVAIPPALATIRFLATMPSPVYGAFNPPALAAVTIANSVSAPTNLLLFGTRPPTTAASGEAALTLFSTFSALGLDPLVPIEVQLVYMPHLQGK